MTKSRSLTVGRAGAGVVICGILLGACNGGTGHHATGPPMSSAPKAISPVPATPGTTGSPVSRSPEPDSTWPPSTVSALARPAVTFTGETVRAFAQVQSSTAMPLLVTWADFGDGSGVITFPAATCRASPAGPYGLVNSPPVSHRYARPGQHTIRIWARLGCGPDQPVQSSTAMVYAYRSAPPAAAGWPRCQPGQLSAALGSMGAATGHVGVQVVLRNVSAVPCHLYGFPGLQLLNASGVALPTITHWGGSFLFPALSPHLVGLAPAQKASFDLAYVDIPIGNPPPSYQQACPAAATLAIIPPDDFTPLSTTAKDLSLQRRPQRLSRRPRHHPNPLRLTPPASQPQQLPPHSPARAPPCAGSDVIASPTITSPKLRTHVKVVTPKVPRGHPRPSQHAGGTAQPETPHGRAVGMDLAAFVTSWQLYDYKQPTPD